jgi:outer membrane immunogenic protein
MKRILVAGAALLALTVAQPTLAADAPVYRKASPPPAVALFNWTGFYVGLNGGAAWGRSAISNTGGVTTGPFGIEGWLFGGTIGANWQTGNIVWGIEGDLSWTDINGTSFVNCGSGCTTDVNWLGTLRGRVGFTGGAALFYLTAGLAGADIRIFSGNGVVSGRSTEFGWTAGGGIEFLVAPNWSLKGEYLYVDIGRAANGVPATTFANFVRLHILRAGLNWRF